MAAESAPLVDIGVNGTSKQFKRDWPAVARRACEAGVRTMVLTGCSVKGSREALGLARSTHGGGCVVLSTAGVHPHDAKSCDEGTLAALRELASAPHVVAVGECGLDFNRNFSPRDVQLRWFAAQVDLAIELGMPLFVHEREAHAALLSVLEPRMLPPPAAAAAGGAGGAKAKAAATFPVPLVVHCFTGSAVEAARYVELGFHLSFAGTVCMPRRGRHLRETVLLAVPVGRLMLETDAPFMSPDKAWLPAATARQLGVRGGKNECAVLPAVARALADAMGCDAADLATATAATASAFFGLDAADAAAAAAAADAGP